MIYFISLWVLHVFSLPDMSGLKLLLSSHGMIYFAVLQNQHKQIKQLHCKQVQWYQGRSQQFAVEICCVCVKSREYSGHVRLGYSGIRIYSGIHSRIYSGYSAPGSRIAGMEIQVFWNNNSSQTNAFSRYSNYSYSGLIPNECALALFI